MGLPRAPDGLSAPAVTRELPWLADGGGGSPPDEGDARQAMQRRLDLVL
jgi:hypothetical protein